MLTQADKFHQRIHDQGHVLFPRIKPGTRPRPIRWMIHEAATDRIVVQNEALMQRPFETYNDAGRDRGEEYDASGKSGPFDRRAR